MRIGIDLGGTKIEGLALDASGMERARLRIPTPQHDYAGTIRAITHVVSEIEKAAGAGCSVGLGIPGTVVPETGLVKNANSTWLNGHPIERDLAAALGRPVRCANDANCLAISEAADGAARGAALVFAVILGTGCGGGIAVNGRVHVGPNGVAGEWGHNPLPWASGEEFPGPACYCGQRGCIETWISGTGLQRDHTARNPHSPWRTGPEIVHAAQNGDPDASESLARLESRIGRALASVVNLLDPDVIVVGGGLSGVARIYENVPSVMAAHLFGGGTLKTPLRKAAHGDASGVRGAAWLWPEQQ